MSKLLNMKVPSPGESISEVELIEWLVSSGDYVEKDQSIAEVDSDKATLELPAEESGVINILVDEGEIVNVGQVVCTIDTSVKKKEKKNVSISEKPTVQLFDSSGKFSALSTQSLNVIFACPRKLSAGRFCIFRYSIEMTW